MRLSSGSHEHNIFTFRILHMTFEGSEPFHINHLIHSKHQYIRVSDGLSHASFVRWTNVLKQDTDIESTFPVLSRLYKAVSDILTVSFVAQRIVTRHSDHTTSVEPRIDSVFQVLKTWMMTSFQLRIKF